MTRPSPAVGIDLGADNSVVAFIDAEGRAETLRNDEGKLTTPSAVFFDPVGPIIGSAALEAGRDEPERLALLAKQDLGSPLCRSSILGQRFPPEVFQALILGRLQNDAAVRSRRFAQAVLTIPSFYDETCRKAMQDAALLAGVEAVGLISEPLAAALCYAVQHKLVGAGGGARPRERVLVYDLGAAKLDVAVIEMGGCEVRALASGGDRHLGGVQWDQTIVEQLAETWMAEHKDDPRQNAVASQDLTRKAQQAKHALSQRESVAIPFSYRGQRIRPMLSRRQLEQRTESLVERSMTVAESVLEAASMQWSDLSRVILVGGATRMPMIGTALAQRFDREPDRTLAADEAVAHGAAIYAAVQRGEGGDRLAGISVSDVSSQDLGVLITNHDTGRARRRVVIPRNTSLPATRGVRYRTHADDQQSIEIEIVEGGDEKGRGASAIGTCRIVDLPSQLAKGTAVEIRFAYSPRGTLSVSASLPENSRDLKTSLHRASGMTDQQRSHWKRKIDAGFVIEPHDGQSQDVTDNTGSAQADRRPTVEEASAAAPVSKRQKNGSDSHAAVEVARPLRKLRRRVSVTDRHRTPSSKSPSSKSPTLESQPIIKLVRKPSPAPVPERGDDWKHRRQRLSSEEPN